MLKIFSTKLASFGQLQKLAKMKPVVAKELRYFCISDRIYMILLCFFVSSLKNGNFHLIFRPPLSTQRGGRMLYPRNAFFSGLPKSSGRKVEI